MTAPTDLIPGFGMNAIESGIRMAIRAIRRITDKPIVMAVLPAICIAMPHPNNNISLDIYSKCYN